MEYTLRLCAMTIFVVCCAGTLRAQFLGQQSLSESSYVIDQSGNLWAWGSNDFAQLGTGDRVDRDTPYRVPLPEGASRWTLVAGGQSFTLALADSDKLYAWGLNDKGQLGFGMAGGMYGSPMRIQNPSTTSKWKWISAGAKHCEALTTDGRLFAWGDNSQGQLGPGNTKYLVTPEPVEFPTGVTSWAAVAAGPGYTMMIAQNGLLYGCGIDSLGTFMPWEGPQLVGTDTFRAYSPLSCLGASGHLETRIDQMFSLNDYGLFDTTADGGVIDSVAEVADGGNHYLLLTASGAIAGNGNNTYGELTGDTAFHDVLVQFPHGVTQWVAVAAGLHHSLAIANDGWLYSWGDDSLGELGFGVKSDLHGPDIPNPVMRVCPPIAMSAHFSAPIRSTGPFPVTLTVKNTSASISLTNGNAFLVPGKAVSCGSSAPDTLLPSPLPPKDTTTALWNTNVGPAIFTDSLFSPDYFVYIQANGSAPLLIPSLPGTFPSESWRLCQQVLITDSVTSAPISGAEIVNPGPIQSIAVIGMPFDSEKMISDSNGYSLLCAKGPLIELQLCPDPKMPGRLLLRTYPFSVIRENYRTQDGALTEPFIDSLSYQLGASPIVGTFAVPSPPFLGNGLLKVFYPDSLTGYAMSQRGIFRTRDSGVTWSELYVASVDLHDIVFLDAGHGWAVGDSGMILSTSDTGETWQIANTLTTHRLNAIAIENLDTVWAVGDAGTALEYMGGAWSVKPFLTAHNFYAVHFLNDEHGAIAGDSIYFLYDTGLWRSHTIDTSLRAVYEVTPSELFLAGANGTIAFRNPNNFVCLDLDAFPPDSIVDTVTVDSTYTTHTINNLYFLNELTGFAMGDSGSSFVTYDGGISWAPMSEFPHSSSSVNFFSLAGHAAMDNAVLNYTADPSPLDGLVRGRLTFGNPPEPIPGAEIDRIYVVDTFTYLLDTHYTSNQGNFLFADLDTIFHYEYVMHFTDSGVAKTHTFANIRVGGGQIVTLNYNDYAPPQAPPPDTNLAVNPAPDDIDADALALDIRAMGGTARIAYNVPAGGMARIVMQDILGRTVGVVVSGVIPDGEQIVSTSIAELPAGAYYVTLATGNESITKKFVKE